MNVTREEAKDIRAEIEAAVAAVFTGRGFAAPRLGCSYGPSLKVTITAEKLTVGENGVNQESQAAAAYKVFHASFGLPDGLLGTVFPLSGGGKARFDGINPKAPKYPLVITRLSDNVQMKATRNMADRIITAATL